MLLQDNLTPDTLINSILTTYKNAQSYKVSLQQYPVTNSCEQIAKILTENSN